MDLNLFHRLGSTLYPLGTQRTLSLPERLPSLSDPQELLVSRKTIQVKVGRPDNGR